MATDIDICNLALSLLGEAADVVSIDPSDGSENAGLCNRWFPLAKKRLFEEANWSFAQRRVRLSQLNDIDAALYGCDFAYAFPSDAVRLIAIYELEDDSFGEDTFTIGDVERFCGPDEWRVEFNPNNSNRMILTNVKNAAAHYTGYIDAVSLYPAYFTEPLVLLLASYLTGSIKRTSSASTEALNLQKQYQQALSMAKTIDAQATTQQVFGRVPSKISSRWV